MDVAHAVKGAALAAGIEAEGREAFVQWSEQWGGDPDEPGRVWDSITRPGWGWGRLKTTLRAVNPAGAARVDAAEARAAFAQAAAQNVAAIVSNGLPPARAINPAMLPPRAWLYGKNVVAGFVSVLAAPGAQGKTSLIFAELVAMCSGQNLLGDAPVRPLKAWYHSAEDDLIEAERRLAATLKLHDLTHADLGGRLFMTSGRDKAGLRIKLARMGRSGPEEVPGALDGVVELANSEGVDVIVFDPIAAMSELPENDNTAISFLMDILRQIADRTGAAVVFLHHSGKEAAKDMDAAGAGAVRGAGAFTDQARIARTLLRMKPEEAAKFGIPEDQRRSIIRIADPKRNMSPYEDAAWVRLVGVPLGNGAGYWPQGDFVGAAEAWTPPTAQPGTGADLARVQAALSASPRPPRADFRSPDWVGWTVGTVMGLDTGGPATPKDDRTPAQNAALARIRAIVAGWVQSGGLVEREEKDPDSRKLFKFVYVGKPAVLMEDTGPETGAEVPAEQGAAENAE